MPRSAAPSESNLRRSRKTLTAAVITAAALVSIGATAAGAQAAEAGAGGTPAGKGWVRAAHLVPGFGAARIDLAPVGSSTGMKISDASVQMSPKASYGDVTPYQQLAAGAYQVTVRDPGASMKSAPVLSRAVTIAGDKSYTLAVLGTAKAPRLATLTDDLTPPAADQARVRVLPAASQAPQVTVTAKGGPTLADNAVLGQASDYASVPAGTWALNLKAGAGMSAEDTIKVSSGKVYTLLLLDGPSGQPRFDLITDAAGTSVAPRGGAATGGGGMATRTVGSPPGAGSSLVIVPGFAMVLIGVALGLRFGPARLRAARRRLPVR